MQTEMQPNIICDAFHIFFMMLYRLWLRGGKKKSTLRKIVEESQVCSLTLAR